MGRAPASPFCRMSANRVIDRDPDAFALTPANGAKAIRCYDRRADPLPAVGGVGTAVRQRYDLALVRGTGEQFVPRLADGFAALDGFDLRSRRE